MKKFFVVFLVLFLIFSFSTYGYAGSAVDQVVNVNTGNYQAGLNNSGQFMADQQSIIEAGFTEVLGSMSGIVKTVFDLIMFIPQLILEWALNIIMVILPSMESIVFNEGVWGSIFRINFFDTTASFSLAYGFRGFVSAVYQAFRYIALIIFIIAISIIAIKLLISSVASQKAHYKELLKHWVIGILLLVAFHWVMIFSIKLGEYFVGLFAEIKEDVSVVVNADATNAVDGFFNGVDNILDDATDLALFGLSDGVINNSSEMVRTFVVASKNTMLVLGILGIIAAGLAFCVFLYINFQVVAVYLKRLIAVAVLIMVFPLITVFYVFEKTGIKKGDTFGLWLREFLSNVFIQPVHALILIIILGILETNVAQYLISIPLLGLVLYLIMLNMLFTVENMIEKLFGMSGVASLGKPLDMGRTLAGLGAATFAAGRGLNKAGISMNGLGNIRRAFSGANNGVGASGRLAAGLGVSNERLNELSAKWGNRQRGGTAALAEVGKALTGKDKKSLGRIAATTMGGYVGAQMFDAISADWWKDGVNGRQLKNAANAGQPQNERERQLRITLSKFNDMQIDDTMKKLGMNSMADLYDANGSLDQRKANLLMAALIRPDLDPKALMDEVNAPNGGNNIHKLLNEEADFMLAKDVAKERGQLTEGLKLSDDAVANVMKNGVKGEMLQLAANGDAEQARIVMSKFNDMQIDNKLSELGMTRADLYDANGNLNQRNANLLMASLVRNDIDKNVLMDEDRATDGKGISLLLSQEGSLMSAKEEAKARYQSTDGLKLSDDAVASVMKDGLRGKTIKAAFDGDGVANAEDIRLTFSKFNDMQIDNKLAELGMTRADIENGDGTYHQQNANLLMAALVRPDVNARVLKEEDWATMGASTTQLLDEQSDLMIARDQAKRRGQSTEGIELSEDAIANVLKGGIRGKMIVDATNGNGVDNADQIRTVLNKFNDMQIEVTLEKLGLTMDDVGYSDGTFNQANANLLMAGLLRKDLDIKMIKSEDSYTSGASTSQLLNAQGELLIARTEAKERGQSVEGIDLYDTVKANAAQVITISRKSIAVDGYDADGELSTDIKNGGVATVAKGANVRLNMVDNSVASVDTQEVIELRDYATRNVAFDNPEVLRRIKVRTSSGEILENVTVESVAKARVITTLTDVEEEQQILTKVLLNGIQSLEPEERDTYMTIRTTKLGGNNVEKVVARRIESDSGVSSLVYAQNEGYIKKDAIPESIVYDAELGARTVEIAQEIHRSPSTQTPPPPPPKNRKKPKKP